MPENKTITTTVDELKSVWESELKPSIEAIQAESKTHGEMTAETKQYVEKVQDRMDALELQAKTAMDFAKAKSDLGAMSQERKDFMEWTRKGVLPNESKIMTASDQSTGGVFAPADFIAEIVKGVTEYSPIRSLAKVRATSSRSVMVPKRTGRGAALWINETETRTPTQNPTYGLEEVANHEMYARVLISNQDLEDAVVDLEGEIIAEMVEQFGLAEATAFVLGNHPKQPEGLLVNSDVEIVTSGTSTLKADDVITARFSLKEPYWANAQWLMNRLTLRDLRLLKDSNGNFMYTLGIGQGAGVAGGVPAMILDTPYTLATDMPANAASAKAIMIGDFSKGYMISDRIELQWLRDPYTAASNGAVVFHGRKRVGGQVILPEALKILQIHS